MYPWVWSIYYDMQGVLVQIYKKTGSTLRLYTVQFRHILLIVLQNDIQNDIQRSYKEGLSLKSEPLKLTA